MKTYSKYKDSTVSEISYRPRGSNIDVQKMYDRELRNGSFNAESYKNANIVLIGAGGLGSNISYGLVKKGVGRLTICDGDTVDITNLHRQKYKYSEIGKPKASTLTQNLKNDAIKKIKLKAVDLFFEEAIDIIMADNPAICICAPDNDDVRYLAAEYCFESNIPFITMGLSENSDYGYIFIQHSLDECGCWQCYRKGNRGRQKCGVTANLNLPLLFSALTLTACDHILSKSELPWTYRRLSLSGQISELNTIVPKWKECPVCSNK